MSRDQNWNNPWPAIKARVPGIEEALMGLPSCNVWTHEKQIHHLLKVPEGPSFGQRKSLNCILKGIGKGHIGNRELGKMPMKNHIVNFDKEYCSDSRIKYQKYGSSELFSNGKLCDPTRALPRYFCTGDCLTDAKHQVELADDLTGASPNLADDVAERR